MPDIQQKLDETTSAKQILERKLKELDLTYDSLTKDYAAKRNAIVLEIAEKNGSITTLKEILNGERKENREQS